MPSASANISAKFIDQIEMSAIRVPIQSEPAAAINPTIVSISGSPAATSEPNASTRIASVTGHEISSDFIIADRFAWLKSDHVPGAPVRSTRIPSVPELRERALQLVGRAHHVVRAARRARPDHGGVAIRRDRMSAAAPSSPPGCARARLAPRRSVRPNAGSETVVSRRVDHDRLAVAPQPVEVVVDQLLAPGPTRTRSPPSRLPTAPSPRAARGGRGRPRAGPRCATTVAKCVAVQRPSLPSRADGPGGLSSACAARWS